MRVPSRSNRQAQTKAPADEFGFSGGRPLRFFRTAVALAQGASILLTWPLWQARELPPNLPALEGLPPLDFGWLLLATLLLAAWRPAAGAGLHGLVLLAAILWDQMRIQPEFISLAILLAATLPFRALQTIGRAHLVCMWLYAGTHKLLSERFLESTGPAMVQHVLRGMPDAPAVVLSALGAMSEIALAILLLFPKTRRAGAIFGCVLHLSIFFYLVFVRQWNSAVWPWNLVLAAACFAMFTTWRETPAVAAGRDPLWGLAAAAILLVAPAGYYLGLTDAYLAHCLYSSNTPVAVVEEVPLEEDQRPPGKARQERLSDITLRELNVPFPPAHRLFDDYHERTANPRRKITVRDPRSWASQQGFARRELTFSGRWVERYDSGVRKWSGGWQAGERSGPWTSWHENGTKKSQGNFKSGRRDGLWTKWDEEGRVISRGRYRDGLMVGTWQVRFGDGELLEHEAGETAP